MRRNKMIIPLLCTGLLMTCMTGCGAAGNDAGAGDEVRIDENTDASDDAEASDSTNADEITVEVTAADEKSSSDTQNENEQAESESVEDEDMFEGLGLSILGDSISTYDGYIPEGFAVMYPHAGDVTDVSQTWWMKLLEDTGMELCSNDSSSGSTCIGDSKSIDDPKVACSDYRISLLVGAQGRMPDVIIVYMGTNDLLIGMELGDNDGTKVVEDEKIWNFSDAYTMILDKLASDYPAAQVYCCTLAPIGDWGTDQPFVTFTNHRGLTFEDYSERIRVIANNKGIPVMDLTDCGIGIDNLDEMTSDGVHLTPDGMECVERAMLETMGFAQE